MKIGVVSDSHGNIEYVKKAGQYLKHAGCGVIAHLGDEYEDADVLKAKGVEILKVPGVYSCHYLDPCVPNRIVKEFDGAKALITHSLAPHSNDLPDDRDPQEIIKTEGIKVVFYGHTHTAKLENKGSALYVNPGHLRKPGRRVSPATFAVVDIQPRTITARIIDLVSLKEVNSLSMSF